MTPPSDVPVLFDDHRVDVRPNRLVSGRLLVALGDGKTVYVPLQALLAQLGATVQYDPATQTALIEKSGISLTLTVGVARAVVDGVARPLDVPPLLRNGVVLVPLRVIAEAMGAYVAYVPRKRTVVVRYVPLAPPLPVPLATVPAPVPAPTPVPPRPVIPPGPPIPVATPQPETFVVADATRGALGLRAAAETSVFDVPLAVGAAYTRSAFDVHLGAQVTPAKLYLAAGYGSMVTTYGNSRVSGAGFGIEKLPVLDERLSYEAGVLYYPHMSSVTGSAYDVLTYRAGITYGFGQAFLDAGFEGDTGSQKAGSPASISRQGVYAGVGVRL
jgi:Copper amine oxidase N-terminal domain